MTKGSRSGTGRENQPTWQPVATVGMLTTIVAEQRAALDTILALAQQIEGHTIEKVLATSDRELGLRALLSGGHIR
ncbi:MAG: hypothetical protein ACRDRW_12230 [Pseudonocardiaceae bacterium]